MKLFTTLLLAASTASSFAISEETILVTKTITSAANIEQDLADVLPSASIITRWDIEHSTAATVIDLLQSEPGIEIGRNGGPGTVSSIFMRGQASKNVAVFVDGVRLQTDALGSVLYNNIPLSQIERVEILRGNMSALYGNSAVGGAILIFTKSGSTADSFNANVSYGSRDTQEVDLSFNGKSDDISYNLSVNDFSTENRSAINPLQKTTTDSDTDPFKNTGFSSRIEWTPTVNKKLGINLSKSTGKVNYDGTYYDPAPSYTAHYDYDFYANQDSDTLIIYGSNKFTEALQSSFNVNRSTNTYHEYIEGVGQTPKKANQTTLTINNLAKLNSKTITFGAEISDADYKDANNDINRASQSLFGGFNGSLGNSIDYQLNVRHDSIDSKSVSSSISRNDSANTWLIGGGYDLNESIRATAIYSTSFAAPTADEFAGNPNLNAEEHKGYELVIDYKSSNWISGLTYFKNRSSNAIIYTSNSIYENISYDNAGFEFDLSGSIDQINYKLSHVIQNPKDETGERLSRRAKNYSTLELSGLYNSYDWLVQIIYSGDRDNSYWDDQILKSYTVTNFSVSKKINNNWTAKLKFENLFNKEYQLAYSYDAVPFGAFLSIQYQPK